MRPVLPEIARGQFVGKLKGTLFPPLASSGSRDNARVSSGGWLDFPEEEEKQNARKQHRNFVFPFFFSPCVHFISSKLQFCSTTELTAGNTTTRLGGKALFRGAGRFNANDRVAFCPAK